MNLSPQVGSRMNINPRIDSQMAMSPQMASGSFASGSFVPTQAIPKVCQNLVMDNVESRFAVNLEALAKLKVGSYIDIIAPSRRPLLCLVAPNGNRLDICLQPHGSMPRCSIITGSDGVSGEIRGAAGGVADRPYGQFRLVTNMLGR